MKILGIETATNNLTVAVNVDNHIQSVSEGSNLKKHMVSMMGCIDQALKKAETGLEHIDMYAVDVGPGDFTGTRIGLSVAKTLAWAQGKPAYGVNMLDALAVQALYSNFKSINSYILGQKEVLLAPCTDVRRGEIFFGFYGLVNDTEVKENPKTALEQSGNTVCSYEGLTLIHIAPYNLEKHQDLKPVLANKAKKDNRAIFIFGNALSTYDVLFRQLAGDYKNIIIDPKNQVPGAGDINTCAWFKHLSGARSENLEPYYVREFVPFGGKLDG